MLVQVQASRLQLPSALADGAASQTGFEGFRFGMHRFLDGRSCSVQHFLAPKPEPLEALRVQVGVTMIWVVL